MTTFSSFFLSFILLLVAHTSAEFTCESTSSCENGGVSIQFPFSLSPLSNQTHHCGYPGFDLSCSNITTNTHSFSQPLLTLPKSGDYVVKLISLEDQKVWINDPNECFPQRMIHNQGLNLQGSPFQLSEGYTLVNFSFLNCPSNITSQYIVQPITCLNISSSDNIDNNLNYSVLAVISDPPFPMTWVSSCQLISTALIPVEDMPWLFWTNYYSDIMLEWVNPNCASCEARGGRCGFLGDTTFNVDCFDLPRQSQGLSRKTKYSISLGVGIPALLGIILLTLFFCGKMNPRDQQRRSIEFSTLILPTPPVVVMGLDGATIERYPKTQLDESGRLPKSSDNICSICLCDYQPKEMFRTIPECNHYFHVNCIDGWLKLNATCPLCRNLPEFLFNFYVFAFIFDFLIIIVELMLLHNVPFRFD